METYRGHASRQRGHVDGFDHRLRLSTTVVQVICTQVSLLMWQVVLVVTWLSND
jgi:hypothetical protein